MRPTNRGVRANAYAANDPTRTHRTVDVAAIEIVLNNALVNSEFRKSNR